MRCASASNSLKPTSPRVAYQQCKSPLPHQHRCSVCHIFGCKAGKVATSTHLQCLSWVTCPTKYYNKHLEEADAVYQDEVSLSFDYNRNFY